MNPSIGLPETLTLTFSLYTPGSTRTVEPGVAAFIAC